MADATQTEANLTQLALLMQAIEEVRRQTLLVDDLSQGILEILSERFGLQQGLILLDTELYVAALLPQGELEMLPEIVLEAMAEREPRDGEWDGRMAWCAPFFHEARFDGAIVLATDEPLTQTQRQVLTALMPFVALTLEQRKGQSRIVEQERQLTELGALYEDARQRAVTDGLTGLYNHAHFKELLALEFARCKRYGSPLTLLLVDIDYFKKINDTYGHLTGDVVLRRVSHALRGQVRDCDWVARYGGEEMAILLPSTDLKGALVVAERIRRYVRDMVFFTEEKLQVPPITVSIGVAQQRKSDTPTELINRADQALYQGKTSGRNQVCAEFGEMVVPAAESKTHHQAFLTTIAEIATEVALTDQSRSTNAEELAELANALGFAVGLSANQRRDMVLAASLLHVGKIALPAEALTKGDDLDDKELALVKGHPQLSKQIVEQIAGMGTVADAILYHHEHWDGSGFPYGIRGAAIPLVSRVLAVVDTFLTELKDAQADLDSARDVIREGSGTHFDPEVVRNFERLLDAQMASGSLN
ncbi:Response regulator PleD [compost metagenome]